MQDYPNEYMELRPLLPTGIHPVATGSYIIPTNEVLRMYSVVSSWIKYRSPGGIIFGRPRIGKTRAIEYLMKTLPNEFGNDLPVFHIKSVHTKIANDGFFFETLLKDVGHGDPFTGKPNIKRDRLAKFLLDKGYESKHRKIILFIDDAQCLHEMQYGWLMDIFNELDRYRICLTCILVGQEQLVHRRNAFKLAKKDQLIGRFMVHDYQFSGLESKEDLIVCLQGFDQMAEFPVGSGWSYTRYFFPETYAMGKRLEQCADDLYDVFTELRQQAKITRSFDIPMQYVITSIEFALLEFGADGQNVGWLNKELWEEAVQASGFINAELHYSG